MTDEEIRYEIGELNDQISDLKFSISKLHALLKANSPIQPGDRIRVITPFPAHWRKGEPDTVVDGQCTELEIDDWNNDKVRIIYYPITKSGTVAKIGRAYPGQNSKVEKIS